MAKLDELFKAYAPVTKEKLWEKPEVLPGSTDAHLP